MGELLLVLVVGFVAAGINGVVGSGTLISYPALLSVGLTPIVANGTNSIGLLPGGLSAAWAYRQELRERLRLLLWPTLLAMTGNAVGALLVVRLPPAVFTKVVPWLIVAAVVLVAVQPLIMRALRTHPHHRVTPGRDLPFWTFLLGTYAGYFGAGQGVMYYGVLNLRYDEDLQHVNAAKNLISSIAAMVSSAVFVVSGVVSWPFALALWVGGIVGGYYGARLARRVSAPVLRGFVIAIGLYAAAYVLLRH